MFKNIKKSYNNCLTYHEGWRFMADVGESVIFISYFLLQHFDVNENLLSVSLENVRIYTMKQHRTKQKTVKVSCTFKYSSYSFVFGHECFDCSRFCVCLSAHLKRVLTISQSSVVTWCHNAPDVFVWKCQQWRTCSLSYFDSQWTNRTLDARKGKSA